MPDNIRTTKTINRGRERAHEEAISWPWSLTLWALDSHDRLSSRLAMPPWLLKLQLEACSRYVQIRSQRLCLHGHLELELEACGCYGQIWLQSLQSWPIELEACDCHGQMWFWSSQPWPLELEARGYSLLSSKLYSRHGQIELWSLGPRPFKLVPRDHHGQIGFKVHNSGYSSSSLKHAAAVASRA